MLKVVIKVSALCGAVALGAGMFIGCSEQGDGAENPALQGLANPALQGFAEEALRDGIAQYGAADGCVIVMDAKTGAVLAQHGDVEERYELGSVIKPLTVAVAVESDPRKYGRDTVYKTDPYETGYENICDDGPHAWEQTMTVREAVVKSSNIVISKLAYDLGPEALRKGFARFGIAATDSQEIWDKANVARVGIGHGIEVSPMQLVNAYRALAATKEGGPVSLATARKVREMMLDVASPEGTARRAAIEGVKIAGKTGTAQKQVNGVWQPGAFHASFVGIVPADDPKYVIYVMLDFDKRAPYHQGGNSAGPIWRRIAMKVLGLEAQR